MDKGKDSLDSKDTILSVLGFPEVTSVGYSMRTKFEDRMKVWGFYGEEEWGVILLDLREKHSGLTCCGCLSDSWRKTQENSFESRQDLDGYWIQGPKEQVSRARDWKITRQSEQGLIPWGVLKLVLMKIIVVMVGNIACLPPESLSYPGCHTPCPPYCLSLGHSQFFFTQRTVLCPYFSISREDRPCRWFHLVPSL